MSRTVIIAAGVLSIGLLAWAQGPSDFNPPIGTPTWEADRGPRVAIDAGHGNFHTIDGTYRPFADLLRRDGYRVAGRTGPFTAEALREVDVLAIVSATGPRGAAPADASPFTPDELVVVDRWVREGGALLLVADHEPWPAAAAPLASRFGVEYTNAYVYDGPAGAQQGTFVFEKADGRLLDHPVTAGVERVGTFLGSALRVEGDHVPVLRLSPAAVARPTLGNQPQPDEESIGGWLQGALVEAGRGRVGVFAEAAMFTAQVRGQLVMGMNAPEGRDNPRLLLNVFRWLTDGYAPR